MHVNMAGSQQQGSCGKHPPFDWSWHLISPGLSSDAEKQSPSAKASLFRDVPASAANLCAAWVSIALRSISHRVEEKRLTRMIAPKSPASLCLFMSCGCFDKLQWPQKWKGLGAFCVPCKTTWGAARCSAGRVILLKWQIWQFFWTSSGPVKLGLGLLQNTTFSICKLFHATPCICPFQNMLVTKGSSESKMLPSAWCIVWQFELRQTILAARFVHADS